LHLLLFVITCTTAILSQPMLAALGRGGSFSGALAVLSRHPDLLADGVAFGTTLMAILLAHEMGHYLTARVYGVDQTLPFFIPFPNMFGTLGAVILMRSQPPNRSALMNVAVMGPYAGLVLAIPATAWGLMHSTPFEITEITQTTLWFGSSLLFQAMESLFSPNGTDVILHPVALAGWVGCFVTSLNLIPASQLDGGHVAYALFGRYQERVSLLVTISLLGVGMLVSLFDGLASGFIWILWSVLLFRFGIKHPPVRDETRPLTRGQTFSGVMALVVFVLTFIPVPLRQLDPGDPIPGQQQDSETIVHDEEIRL